MVQRLFREGALIAIARILAAIGFIELKQALLESGIAQDLPCIRPLSKESCRGNASFQIYA